MVFLDDLKEMTLYKKPFVLPIDEENIRKGSAIFLVSPNAETSKAMMNYPYMINKMNTFNGYYLEKNANYYINQEGNLVPIDRDDEYLHEVSEDCIEEKYTYYNNNKYKKVPKSAKLYHGSRIQNLKELTPKNDSVSRVGNATAVYASKDKRFAACYGTAWRDDIAKQGTWDKWNTVVMGISDKVVMDQPCSLYELENDGSFIEISDKEVVSLNAIKVKKEHKYSSYAEMLKQNGVKVISYDEYIKNVKSPNPEFHYLNECFRETTSITEAHDFEKYNPNFKKKTGGNFEFIDIHDAKAQEYLASDKYYNKQIKKYISIINGEIVVDKDTGKVAGAIYVGGGNKKSNRNYGFIQTLEVYKPYRGYGLSNKLIDDAIKKYNAVDLTVYKDNDVASELYKKHGFVIIGPGNTKHSDYWMKLKSRLTEEDKKRMEAFNEAGTDEFEYSNSFTDVMKVVNSLPKNDLLRICNGRFKDSPYVIYREVLSVSGSPVAFIDVYKLPNMEEDGCIVLATNPKWRGKGLASILVERMKHAIGDKNLIWKTQQDNHASLAIASANGYSPVFDEAALSSKERNELSDSDFGIPSLRKYPLTDAQHVKSAIRFFNYVDSEHEAELAKNIKRKAIEFKVPIRCGEGNRLSKYITEEYVQEFMSVASIGNDMTAVCNGTIRQHMAQGDMVYSFDHQKPYTKKTKKKIISESYIFSKDDMYINYDKFESGKSNVLLVTGLSGSGKSTLASKTKGAEWIELDIYETANCFTDDQLKQAGQVFVDFFNANPDRDAERKKRDYTITVEDIRKFCKYAISWCNRHKEKKWVVDGVQIYSVMDYDDVKPYPMIIKGTSMVKSIIGRFKRNGEGKINWKNELSNEFLNLIGWYKDEERILRNFKKAIIEEDANESADDPEDVFFDDMIKDIEKFCNEEPEPFPTDVLNEKKGSH